MTLGEKRWNHNVQNIDNDISMEMQRIASLTLAVLCIFGSAAACSSPSGTLTDVGQGYEVRGLQAPWDRKTAPTRFSIHSTAERVFFSYEVTDSTLALKTPFESELDVNPEDRVEIFFAPGSKSAKPGPNAVKSSLKRPYYCAEIDPDGHIMDYRARFYRKFDYKWNFETMEARGSVTPWGYRVEGSVSRAELQRLGIDLDGGFWMGVYQADFTPSGDVVWYSLVPDDVDSPDFHTTGVMMPCRCTPKAERRGVVIYPDDITTVGLEEWSRRIDLAGINLIGLHAATNNDPIDTLEAFIRSDMGRDFLALCESKEVDVEYELHALEYLLPRDLFDTHPEWFRMDAEGRRCRDFNMCFSSDEAVEAMRPQLERLLAWARPTTHRYYFWTDDKVGMFCNCPECSQYSPSEQALLYENKLLALLREYDPEATLAHLAYVQTLPAPVKVRAADGVFLEYAPINRDYTQPLTSAQETALRANMAAFPGHSQHILEYWLDESMFSGWKKASPVLLPFSEEYTARDLAAYRGFGAADLTCFATWLGGLYIERFGPTDAIFTGYASAFGE